MVYSGFNRSTWGSVGSKRQLVCHRVFYERIAMCTVDVEKEQDM